MVVVAILAQGPMATTTTNAAPFQVGLEGRDGIIPWPLSEAEAGTQLGILDLDPSEVSLFSEAFWVSFSCIEVETTVGWLALLVAISILDLALYLIGVEAAALTFLRVFRVVRIFKAAAKLEAFRKIIASIVHSAQAVASMVRAPRGAERARLSVGRHAWRSLKT